MAESTLKSKYSGEARGGEHVKSKYSGEAKRRGICHVHCTLDACYGVVTRRPGSAAHAARPAPPAGQPHRERRMPKKGGKGKGKKKEPDWGEIVREQYVTIEVRDDHAATATRCVVLQMQCLTPFADAKLEVALHVFQAHDGRLRAGASLTACSQPALPPGPQPRAQLSGATLAAAGGRATHRALGAAQAGR